MTPEPSEPLQVPFAHALLLSELIGIQNVIAYFRAVGIGHRQLQHGQLRQLFQFFFVHAEAPCFTPQSQVKLMTVIGHIGEAFDEGIKKSMHHALGGGLHGLLGSLLFSARIRCFGSEARSFRLLAPRIHLTAFFLAESIGIVRGIAGACQVAALHIHRKTDEPTDVCRHQRVCHFLVLVLRHGIHPDHQLHPLARNGYPPCIAPRLCFQQLEQGTDVVLVVVDVNHQVSGETDEVRLGVTAPAHPCHNEARQEVLHILGTALVTLCHQPSELLRFLFPSAAPDGGYELSDGYLGIVLRLVAHVVGT